MKKLFAPLALFSAALSAHQVEVTFDVLDGTYVGESKYYYDTEYSDLPGFYHKKNSVEHGISVKYIHNFEDWDAIARFGMGSSELRSSKTYELGARYRLDEQHWFGLRYKGLYALEEYQIDAQVIDPEHQNSITNSEWAQWAIPRYQYNIAKFDNELYVGAETAIELSDDALVEDDFSLLVGYHADRLISEFKLGKELVSLSVGLSFSL